MRNTTCFSGLRPGLVGLALVVALLLLAVPALAAPQTHTNSIGMEFVLIPAGDFEMGCGSSEPESECKSNEKPRHSVKISQSFYLGKYEVTQRQWESVMRNNPSKFKGPDRPVENVSWEDVQEFIKRLNAKEGHTRYRLPTEAEWEYAARAGSTTAYSFGNNVIEVHWSDFVLVSYAWYGDNSEETHPVGQKPPNAWGLHDMHGNVWEWVQDWYGDYSTGTMVDPQGPTTGEDRVLRGGSWSSDAGACRSACRNVGEPDDCDESIGFRLALSPGH